MDPYDDFDPQQYDYGDSDDDCGDIIYLEGPTDSDKDAFLPHARTEDLLPASQLSQSPSALEGAAAPLNLLPRRERKRRRRLEAVARAIKGDDDDSSYASSEHESQPEEEEEGAFASLQDLLLNSRTDAERSAEVSQKSVHDERSQQENDGQQQQQPALDAVTESHPVAVAQHFSHDSQPEFPHPDDDDDDDEWRFSQQQLQEEDKDSNWEIRGTGACEKHSSHPLAAQQATSRIWPDDRPVANLPFEMEMKRQRHHHQKRSTVTVTSSHFSEPVHNTRLLAELDKNRKLSAVSQGARKRSVSHGPRKKARSAVASHQTSLSQPLRSEASDLSIVGSRPQHWGGRRGSGGLLSQQPSVISKRRKPPGNSKNLLNSDPFQTKKGCSLLDALNTHSALSSFHKKKEPRSLPQASEKTAKKSQTATSFAPSFWTSKPRQQTDEVQDAPATQPSNFDPSQQTPLPRGVFSPTAAANSNGSAPHSHQRRRSRKLKAGPLMKRLRSVRGSLHGDKVRFQSGMYPFPRLGISLDRNDPRRRAALFMDVTVCGPPIPWKGEQAHVTVLGFVHCIVPTSKRAAQKPDGTTSAFYAWISFSFETAREQKLQRGAQLRIYNAICLPWPELDHRHGRASSQIVLCTQLCEPYPSILPALSPPAELVGTQKSADEEMSTSTDS